MNISGHLDLCGPSLIEGWLHCGAWQDSAIRLQVYIGEQLVGECTADRFRQDLQDAGYGNGCCGFSFVVPEGAAALDFASTRLRLVGTPVYLLPNEFTTIAPRRQARARQQDVPGESELELAGFAGGALAGYAGERGDRQAAGFRAI